MTLTKTDAGFNILFTMIISPGSFSSRSIPRVLSSGSSVYEIKTASADARQIYMLVPMPAGNDKHIALRPVKALVLDDQCNPEPRKTW